MKSSENKPLSVNNESGQSFIEFILLLVMLIGISYGLMAGINGNIANRWKSVVTIIVQPTDTDLLFFGE